MPIFHIASLSGFDEIRNTYFVVWIRINTDIDGNIFLCGSAFGIAQIDSIHTINKGSFVVKFDINGNCLWAKTLTIGNNIFTFYDIKLFNSDIIINGYTNNDTINFDTIVRYVPEWSKWSAIACMDNNSNAKWLNLYGGNSSVSGNDFSIDNEGNIFTTGYFTGTGYFGNDTLTSTAGQKNMFLAKHNLAGNIQWAKQINASSSQGYGVSNVVDSNLYVTGWFKGTAYFNDSFTADSAQDMFLAKYSTSGICNNVKHFGKAEGWAVEQDKQHAAYVVGNYFTDITIGNSNYTNPGNIFIAKLSGDTGTWVEKSKLNTNSQLVIYANPTTGKCNVTIPEEFNNEIELTLKIFDNSGKVIQQSKVEISEDNIKVNIESEAKGIYNVVLSNGVKSYSGRIVFE